MMKKFKQSLCDMLKDPPGERFQLRYKRQRHARTRTIVKVFAACCSCSSVCSSWSCPVRVCRSWHWVAHGRERVSGRRAAAGCNRTQGAAPLCPVQTINRASRIAAARACVRFPIVTLPPEIAPGKARLSRAIIFRAYSDAKTSPTLA